jgi:PAS domain-containing protein
LGLGTGRSASAAPEAAPQAGNALTMAGDLLVLAIVIGLIIAAGAAAHLFLRAAARARQTAARANDAMTALRQELEVAQSIVMADPQALVAFETGGTPRLVNHGLDPKVGVPAKLRNLMRFASWLERSAAPALEAKLKDLKANGRPFELTLKTLAGPHVEVEGRASASGYYLKIRDLAGRRMEYANLLKQHRALSEELASHKALLDALPLPVWFRDADGKLQWVNRAYATAVEAPRADLVIEQQRELLETRQRRAAETALAAGETFRRRLQTVLAGERRSFDTIVVPVARASAGAVIDRITRCRSFLRTSTIRSPATRTTWTRPRLSRRRSGRRRSRPRLTASRLTGSTVHQRSSAERLPFLPNSMISTQGPSLSRK